MADSYELSVVEDHVQVVYTRPITPAIVRGFLESGPPRIRATGLTRVLIDMRLTLEALTTTDRYFYAVEFAERFRGLRVAVLQSISTFDPQGFGQVVAANRGVLTRAFTTKDAALAWLLAEPQPANEELRAR